MYNSGKECNVIHSLHVVKSRMTVLEEKKGGRSPATGGVPAKGQLLGALWWAKGRGRKPTRRRLQG